ncbi:MAG TPA: molybdopterin molybdotransferase MoeA [Candidatus Tumulicola sp.]
MQPQKALLSETGFAADSLLAPNDALAAFFARVPIAAPQTETIARDDASGRILASPIRADEDYPAATRSAMDGFAIAANGLPGILRIVATVRMGEPGTTQMGPLQAARIPTGGVLPPGTDAVVPIEDVRVDGETITVDRPVAPGDNAIPRGADMRADEVVMEPGLKLHAGSIGLLASLGIERVEVLRRPVIGIVSSGDEIVAPSQRPKAGQVRDSNRYAIAAALRAMGATPKQYPTVGDAAGELVSALNSALSECDAVVASGGSSVGTHDRLPDAVATFDPGVIAHGLRIKPGKPALFGASGIKPVLGLPGNPASALFVLQAVMAPIVYRLAGAPYRPAVQRLRLSASLQGRPGWTWFAPVATGADGARPLELRSFSVSVGARADGYVVIPPDRPRLEAGEDVDVYRFPM